MPSKPAGASCESAIRAWALRLPPGRDLKRELVKFTREAELQAAFIATCVGSLSGARLRMPSLDGEADRVLVLDEPTEVVSLSGTLSTQGLHLHMSLSRRDGQCVGGHLLDGCIVRTTAELVIGELADLDFRRPFDPGTGYRELEVARRASPTPD
jgi:predicted DNA-binding protein with PD1-like motif